ncbi:MAG: adenosine deaminase [Parvibaculaceae bacterium]
MASSNEVMAVADRVGDLLSKLPKTELHLHLEGSIRPTTAIELSRKNGSPLPPYEKVEDFYRFDDLVEFLKIYTLVAASAKTADDFQRITYEMLESCASNGARYVEFFFSPHAHLEAGVPYKTQIDGIRAGMREAGRDFGVVSRLVPGISRELGPPAGHEMLELILSHRTEELIGIGLDYNEAPFPPEPYAGLFAAARRAGLHVTSHAGETGPAAYVRGSLDALKSERIDHGYHVVTDPDLMQRCKDEGVLFTVCPSTSAVTSAWNDLSAPDHAIRQMLDFGLKLSINSDDPPMFFTDLGKEYVKCVEQLNFSLDDVTDAIIAGVEGAWLDQGTKRRWALEWRKEIDALRSEYQI